MTASPSSFGFLLGRSLFGFRLKAIGGNRDAATLARLPVRKYMFAAFIICAVHGLPRRPARLRVRGLDAAERRPGATCSRSSPRSSSAAPASPAGAARVIGTLFGALLLAVLANGLALEAAGPFAQQTLLGTVTIARGGARPLHEPARARRMAADDGPCTAPASRSAASRSATGTPDRAGRARPRGRVRQDPRHRRAERRRQEHDDQDPRRRGARRRRERS